MLGHPFAIPGITVGLLGGSFDPPHEGHVHVTKEAIKYFNLSKLWWLVSPKNPLKKIIPSGIDKRNLAAKKIINHPSVVISDLEKNLKTKYTAETLFKIKKLYPGVKFVWLMGADNLVNFHYWYNWNWIMNNIPIGIFARSNEQVKAGLSLAASKYKKNRIPIEKSLLLPHLKPPVWTLIIGPMKNASSTSLRKKGVWP